MKNRIAFGLVAFTLALSSTAFGAAQDKAQSKCIYGVNKGMAKVAGSTNKAYAKCLKTRAKDGSTDAALCGFTDTKVDAAQTKTCSTETKVCTGVVPGFGHTSCGNVNDAAETEARRLVEDVFGININPGVTLCSGDKAGCKCQQKAFKAATKVYKMRMKGFNKCKKLGLKDKAAPFDAAADLSTCVTGDVKGKIAKAETKLASAITKKCAAVTKPFDDGDCDSLNGASLSTCLARRVKCHTCLTQTVGDNFPLDCDTFDDGNNDNNSCEVEPDVPK